MDLTEAVPDVLTSFMSIEHKLEEGASIENMPPEDQAVGTQALRVFS